MGKKALVSGSSQDVDERKMRGRNKQLKAGEGGILC